jgi:hypothetical protein
MLFEIYWLCYMWDNVNKIQAVVNEVECNHHWASTKSGILKSEHTQYFPFKIISSSLLSIVQSFDSYWQF